MLFMLQDMNLQSLKRQKTRRSGSVILLVFLFLRFPNISLRAVKSGNLSAQLCVPSAFIAYAPVWSFILRKEMYAKSL